MSKTRFIDHKPEPHSHHESPDQDLRPKALKRLKLTLLVGLSLFLIEALGSWFSHSLALLADSFHVLGDLGAVFVTLIASKLAERPKNSRRSYGYYRLEVIAALFNGCLLLGLAYIIFQSAYHHFNSTPEIESRLMLGVAVFGLMINLLMLFVLKPSHQHNLNLRSAYLHILGDTISSCAVIVGAVLIIFTGLSWIDAVMGVFVGSILTLMACRLVWDSIHVLLEGAPKHMNPDEVEETLRKAFPQITNIHDFHIWEITSHLFAMTAHVEAKVVTLAETRGLIDGMNALIHEKYGIGHTTFQVEPSP